MCCPNRFPGDAEALVRMHLEDHSFSPSPIHPSTPGLSSKWLPSTSARLYSTCWHSTAKKKKIKSLREKEVGRRWTVNKIMFTTMARITNPEKQAKEVDRIEEGMGWGCLGRQVPEGRRVSNRGSFRSFWFLVQKRRPDHVTPITEQKAAVSGSNSGLPTSCLPLNLPLICFTPRMTPLLPGPSVDLPHYLRGSHAAVPPPRRPFPLVLLRFHIL